MEKYYRTYNETLEGEGFLFFEVIDQMFTRMVVELNGQLYWSTPTECKNQKLDFTDQPEFDDKDIPDQIANYGLIELSQNDFDVIWHRAQE